MPIQFYLVRFIFLSMSFYFTFCSANEISILIEIPLPTIESDADNDGILDQIECPLLQYNQCPDHDLDFIPDFLDTDSDDNGLLDRLELTPLYDSDADGIPDYLDSNDDNDGVIDLYEYFDLDSVFVADQDCDGIIDIKDPKNGSYCSSSDAENSLYNDSDNDGISDNIEFNSSSSSPADSDYDFIPNYIDADSDNDGYSDDLEADGIDNNGSNPSYLVFKLLDLNSNGVADAYEPSDHITFINPDGQLEIDQSETSKQTSKIMYLRGGFSLYHLILIIFLRIKLSRLQLCSKRNN